MVDVLWQQLRMAGGDLVEVFDDGGRFRQGEVFMNQCGNLAGQRKISVSRLVVLSRLQINTHKFKGKLFFLEPDKGRHRKRADEIRTDI